MMGLRVTPFEQSQFLAVVSVKRRPDPAFIALLHRVEGDLSLSAEKNARQSVNALLTATEIKSKK